MRARFHPIAAKVTGCISAVDLRGHFRIKKKKYYRDESAIVIRCVHGWIEKCIFRITENLTPEVAVPRVSRSRRGRCFVVSSCPSTLGMHLSPVNYIYNKI